MTRCSSCQCSYLQSVLNADTNRNRQNDEKVIDEAEDAKQHFRDEVERNREVDQSGKCKNDKAESEHPLKSTW